MRERELRERERERERERRESQTNKRTKLANKIDQVSKMQKIKIGKIKRYPLCIGRVQWQAGKGRGKGTGTETMTVMIYMVLPSSG